jgi:hypothetical protein
MPNSGVIAADRSPALKMMGGVRAASLLPPKWERRGSLMIAEHRKTVEI